MAVLKHVLFFKLNLCKVITDIVLAVIMLMFALAFTFEQLNLPPVLNETLKESFVVDLAVFFILLNVMVRLSFAKFDLTPKP